MLLVLAMSCLAGMSSDSVEKAVVSAENDTTRYRLMPGDVVELRFGFTTDDNQPYRFSPGDDIEVRFVSFPELSMRQRVRPDGKIALPYLGDIAVADSTPDAVRRRLQHLYEEELSNPEIVVLLHETGGIQSELRGETGPGRGASSIAIKVRSDGYLSLPFAGELQVKGHSLPEVRRMVARRYRSHDYHGRVEVILARPEGNRISVFGAVNDPGFYVVEQPVRLMEALAMAGGLRDDARSRNVVVARVQPDTLIYETIDLRGVLRGRDRTAMTALAPGDVVFVPRSGLSRASDVAQQVVQVLLFKGWAVDVGRFIFP